jgi:hypothetical protein
VKRLLFDQLANETKRGPDIGSRDVVLTMDFIERHAPSQAADDNRHRHTRTTDNGLAMAYPLVDLDPFVLCHAADDTAIEVRNSRPVMLRRNICAQAPE